MIVEVKKVKEENNNLKVAVERLEQEIEKITKRDRKNNIIIKALAMEKGQETMGIDINFEMAKTTELERQKHGHDKMQKHEDKIPTSDDKQDKSKGYKCVC